ncbi:fibronectin type III domain-containing protein [Chitinophaga flava]|uniref:Staphylococcus aureus surface protein A n=1 Tax=Chitinophaga flava TaxID=2259036 RepID=A0A365XQK5_9BACT|nr:fibronectin type III domain-containing protein [Chitinophaga flava]RBL88014.1 hypothetical protein DF182_31250 [Chitinophaga flava]
MNKFYTLLTFLLVMGINTVLAQTGVLNPNDSIVEYNPAAPPTPPNWGVLGKWVRTKRLNWNTDSYKCYYYNGLQFRLKFPKSYQPGVSDGKKYPMIIFWHGVGERGTIYDNEYQLYHGGELHKNAVDNGTFDGFLLYPQNQGGFFGNVQFDAIRDLIVNYMIPEVKLDPYRIMVQGLSGGGTGTWDFMIRYPKLVAAAAPISASTLALKDYIDVFKLIPIWNFQGGTDTNPDPSVTQNVYNAVIAAGGNMKLTIYDGWGHGVWYKAWGEPDYFPFANRAHKANPWPLYGRTEFCPGDTINVTIGVTAGFDAYEWRKDGVIIPGANSNTIVATTTGVYDAHIKDGNNWTSWSPIPVQIKIKTPTITPNINVNGLMSKVIPALDGKDSVVLQLPAGYTSYLWKKATDATTLGTDRMLTVRDSGLYIATVTEQYGCSSNFSAPFKVIKASGTPAPDPATNAIARADSKTQITIDWSRNPNPATSETGYEVYRGSAAGGPYTLVGITGSGVTTFSNSGLNPNKTYYFVIRAVNDNGAAVASNETSATTLVDNNPPTAPGTLKVTGTTRTSVSLSWTAATDDVGVTKYDIYVNGVKTYTVNGDQTSFTVNSLVYNQVYAFTVKARDLTGNQSPASNQVSASTANSGLNYKYYTGAFSVLPNFSTLTPVKTGVTPTADISARDANENYAFLWEGFINIPATGTYTFETYSDDGSRLYIGPYSYTATPLVDNDGLHAPQSKTNSIYLTAGSYPFSATFFQAGGGQVMQLFWQSTINGVTGSRQEIPASAFSDPAPPSNNTPAAPTQIKAAAASYNKINLTWTDNSTNETGFEIYRSTSLGGPFNIIATTAAAQTAYTDSLLQPQTTYYYKVKAINKYGDSGFSLADGGGLQYDYYEFSDITQLPDFNSITPVKSGSVDNITLDIRNHDNNFALKFAGYINLPVSGTYTFYTASDDGSKLYIDGFDNTKLVVNNDYLQGTTERSGTKTLSAGRHAIYITYFQRGGGFTLTASYKGPNGSNIAKQLIPSSALANPNMQATTLALPTTPVAPTALTAATVFSNKISIKWNDNSNNETSFEVYRSVGNNSQYKLQATIPGSDSTYGMFTDTALFANVTYYYKVRAVNVGGNSAYSNELNVQTLNNAPVLNNQPDRYMHYDTQLSVNVVATDADGDPITLTATNLPSFATFTDNGNGTGTILFNNPPVTAQATYPGITVKAQDNHNGVATKVFSLTVNANYAPVLGNVSNLTINENTTSQINVAVTNDNGTDNLTWTYTGLPAFATAVSNGKTSQITLTPGYSDAGSYPVSVKVSDGVGGEDTKNFTIVINDVNPGYFVRVNFNDGSNQAPAPWNNTNKVPVTQNDIFGPFTDQNGNNTGISLKVMTPWQTVNGGSNANNAGVRPGNNSGIYPDNVMASSYWTNTVKQTFKVTGLKAAFKYNFTFFGSRSGVTDNRTANYTINGTTVSLNASNNATNTVVIKGIAADSNGEVSVDLQAGTGSSFAYINAMVIEAVYDDGTVPAKPKQLAARNIPTGVRLSWFDAAYNETGYEVARSTDSLGTYQTLNPAPTNANDTAYTDNTVVANTKYFYAVRAINAYGNSPYTDTVVIVAANRNPVLNTLSNVSMKTDDVQNITVTATDDPSDILTVSATGLPPFATLTTTGNGTATIALTPTAANIGRYSVTVTVADNHGGSTSQTFTIAVRDKNITSIYVNCNQLSPEGAPWNNFNGLPIANRNITNMLDETGVATGASITLIDALTGANNVGAVTGNNSGVFPDNVMNTFFYDQSTTARRIRITGLTGTKKYNLVFFASRADVTDNRTTIYTVGTQSVSLNASSNTNKTVQLNGLSPDNTGTIEFTIQNGTGSLFAYLNALVIQSYVDNGQPLSPESLIATGKSRNTIQLGWTNKASNATGVEIYRSTSIDGAYSLVTTVGGTVSSYTDNGLSESTRYYYKVRAKANTVFSDYSNIATGSTYSHSVYININVTSPQGAPWNNTNSLPFQGQKLTNIKDEISNNTSMVMSIDRNFTGTNPNGMVTGNNSGIYPDNVMAASYYIDKGDTAQLTFSGLNQSMAYSFVFFGSRAGGGDRISAYSINGKVVTLNALNNTSQTVQIDNVVPNSDGEIRVVIYIAPNGQYAYLNALVINAYPKDNTPGADNSITPDNVMMAVNRNRSAAGIISKIEPTKENSEEILVESVYPNPISSFVNLLVKNTGKSQNVTIKVFDLTGRMVYAKAGIALPEGSQPVRVDFNRDMAPGVYLLQVLTPDNKRVKIVKLIKQ